MKDDADKIRARIREDANNAGFDRIGFTSAGPDKQQAKQLDAFIENGFMGDMHWLEETRDRRIHAQAMWPDARTAIVLSMNYGPDHDPMENLNARGCGNISVYARGRDYHDVIKGRLKQIASRIAVREKVAVKVFVDTAPLMEKPLAARAGLGWQGKHTNLVSRDYGSWLFLGVILTDADWAVGTENTDHCGSCTKCLDICPTNAFPRPYQLDARRCISYLTIEHKGAIPREFRTAMGNRIFGCDDCLAVCPWNSFAQRSAEIKFQPLPDLGLTPLEVMLNLDETGFRKRYAGTPVRRVGYIRYLRNVLIAAGNSGMKSLIPWIKVHLDSYDPIVRGSSVWALSCLMSPYEIDALAKVSIKKEKEQSVRQEWALAMDKPSQERVNTTQ
ncbi:tRNA epoxyqueuosine(34) reductase QueG [Alphaproteobacteria bacterium LSUCC0684]